MIPLVALERWILGEKPQCISEVSTAAKFLNSKGVLIKRKGQGVECPYMICFLRYEYLHCTAPLIAE